MLNTSKVRKRVSDWRSITEMDALLRSMSLHTVCEGAQCPNVAECFSNKTATFMILGEICTRGCTFCAVKKGSPTMVDEEEPLNVAKASQNLGLKHIVVTSVTRDDLEDGGASCFAETICRIRELNPHATVEVLIPDLQGNWKALETIARARPEIINHNVETVPSLYSKVRPQADYQRSLELFKQVKQMDDKIFLKSGIMVGLGEKREEVLTVMDDLLNVCCDILTVGQYLQPSSRHVALYEYVTDSVFDELRNAALQKGFKYVAAGPFVRSSYNAAIGMEKLTIG
ncbi:lipoyl synthase [Petroclostridium sp. X23]|uniref:lipoyl synthase n=1 Tax=Petroclostridium sp. X23 TaxID=3045146 RepID=UPI0024ACA173|nr:lipoyl synthase [Petroclostridium sp. X23]WHH57039.1 lipoyl synthase [Petroclostridium sp. X23]